MAFNKLFVMLPLMYASRKLDGEDPNIVFMLRVAYCAIQVFVTAAVLYVFLVAKKLSEGKFKDTAIFVAPPSTPFADPNDTKKQFKQALFGEHAFTTARTLLTSTVFGAVMTLGLHYYRGMIVGLAMQSIMGPINLFENAFAKAILLGGGFKKDDTPKSRRLFGEKFRDELTAKDEIIDAQGNPVVLKKEAKKKITGTPSFEEVLLDTWDAGEKASIGPLMEQFTKKNANFATAESAWTPLMIMAAIGAPAVEDAIKKLKTLGANPSTVDSEGWNALHWAAFHGSASGAKIVLDVFSGISTGMHEVTDKEGKTALEHAKAEGNNDVAAVIEEAIAAGNDRAGLADKEGLRKRK
uniref:Uncharacterized protein n=1 Tax=Chaetoceros debilis TaxID=122233 RepID=A0A7S3PY59_9STRA|mmetsp:Transcript_1561/g.2221  ORF Transcript_1561/g.2221 Transcript_1561/m.2221 type:complete len:353 (-) Transcript_1561:142-1200(-)|eukprot:CAMPEP_0194073380 /NCGR_PEP_ID=MMETSP0149-20130528/831_1 /TAXON_ID=122233 /ORGANISM="Chaetoceros debilis, Strain MM31A-1" /LENGTH=352 /DNA_ID=CAMNT_0038753395 /DNA_START=55 /DNA_END=1113 /DNA_ORIENTATION=-